MTSTFVDVPGATLHVSSFGEGVPVLMPTGGGVAFYENSFSERFRSRVRVCAVEMRGTGASTGTIDGASFGSMADDLALVRQSLGLERAVVLGHSNHGCIALEFALRHPAATAGVVAVATAPDFAQAFPLGQTLWAERAPAARQADLAARLGAFEREAAAIASPDESMLRRYLAMSPLGWRDASFDATALWGESPRGLGSYFDWLFAFAPTWNITPRLAEITAPLLVLSGRHDFLCPVELWLSAIESTPGGRLVVFESSAHNPQFEEADAFDDEAIPFIERCAAETGALV